MPTSKNIIGDELDLQWNEILERWKQMAAECPLAVWENAVADMRKGIRMQCEEAL